MEKEKTQGQQLAQELLYEPELAADSAASLPEQMNALGGQSLGERAAKFCEGYKAFLDKGKTEREVTAYAAELLQKAGYRAFVPGMALEPGDKVYRINREKCVLAATIGAKPLAEGAHLNIAHIDSPRLDLKPNPLYESADLALLKTHYYGGASTSGPPSRWRCTASPIKRTARGWRSAWARNPATRCSASPTFCRISAPSRTTASWPRALRRKN